MEPILRIAEIAALFSAVVLSIYLIIVLIKVKETLISIEKDFKEISNKAVPVFENLEFITSKFKNVADSINSEVENIKESVKTMREIADNIVTFERRLQDRVEVPIMEAASFFSAVVRGIKVFTERLRK
ncbi:MAG: DUF948 domain-containing protein [Bacteroidota bacterium]